jgi:hypothetical protein
MAAPETSPVPESGPVSIPYEQARRLMGIVIAEAVLLVLCVGTVGWLVTRQQDLASVTACQVRYNTAFAAAESSRTESSEADRTATLTLISSVFTPKPGETPRQEETALNVAYQKYRTAEDQVSSDRASHPIPLLPHC